jgi:hypothetical protein
MTWAVERHMISLSSVVLIDYRYAFVPPDQQGATIISDLTQLIYVSQPFGYDDATLAGILIDARRCNLRDDVTGALVCRHDVYLQLLEGPTDKVNATYARIIRDDRHANVQELLNRQITARIFPDWAMLHDPAKSWIWSEAEMSDGAMERATEAEILGLFKNLSAKAKADPSA